MFDTHCHLAFPALLEQVEDVLDRAASSGVRGMITVATGPGDAQVGLELTRRFQQVWCTSGVHPHQAQAPVDWEVISRIAHDQKCLAWGELGLDWHYPDPPRDAQVACLEAHLDCIEQARAGGLEKPIVVHCRESLQDLLEILDQRGLPHDGYVFHCFTGTVEEARKILDFGAWISFTGIVTFESATEIAEAARLVPLDRLMVETDSPYLSPEPVRKVRPNEPSHVVHVARFIADLHGMSYEELESVVDANAQRFFGMTIP